MTSRHLDLVSLDLFLSVADEGSIAAAAERKNIAPSAVSRRLQDLEIELDTPLVKRYARGVKLTPAGEALHRHAHSVFGLLSRIRDEMGEHAQGSRGHIRLATNSSALIEYLPEELARFTARFPRVRLDVRELVSPDIVRAVRDGLADVGLLGATTTCEGLETLPYHDDRLVAVVRAGTELSGRDSVSFEELLPFPQIGLAEGSSIQQTLIDAARAANMELILRLRVGSFEAVRRLVQAGLGVAVLPEARVVPFQTTMTLKAIPLRDPWAKRSMVICVREIRSLPVSARALVDELRDTLPAAGASSPP